MQRCLSLLATPLLLVCAAQAQVVGFPLRSFPTPTTVPTPVGLDHDLMGNLKLTGIGADSVDTIDLNGMSLASFPATMSGNAIGVTTDGTNLYVTDTTGDDVDVYDLSGTYISSFPVNLQTTFPEGIAWNPTNNHLYVVDGSGGNAVHEYDITGVFQASFPILGSSPDGIAYDLASNTYWIYDSGTDLCRQYDSTFTELQNFPGTRAAGFGSGEGVGLIGNNLFVCATGADTVVQFNLDPNLLVPPTLEAVGEVTLNSGTLSTATRQPFEDNWFLRWALSGNTGQPAAVIANLGSGSLPVGMSPQIPGFNQLWAGSTPAGLAIALPPFQVGNSHSFPVPANLLNPGDTLRIQALMLDPSASPLPVVPSRETIEFVHRRCQVFEGFEGLPLGAGNYPMGWANGGGIHEWRVDANGTTSLNTGPTAAFGGSNYMYCETSSPAALNDTYIMNTAVYPSAGLTAVNFQLSRIGATIGTLEVRMGDGSGTFPTLLMSYTGPEPNGIEWVSETLPLGMPPANVQFQFRYSRGTSFTGDIAIDDFCLQ